MRRAIPTVVPLQDMSAEAYHRAGMSCKTPAAHTYDANGYRRWCSDCNAELGEASRHPNGAGVPHRALAAIAISLGLLILILVAILVGMNSGRMGDHGSQVTPAPTPGPTWCGKVGPC